LTSAQYTLIAGLLASPFVGSFLGALVARLPMGKTILWGRSTCDHCSQELAARDLVPIGSWLWLGGRCRACANPIGLTPLFIELAAVAIALMAASETSGWVFLASCAFGWTLITLAIIDWQHYWLPDALTLPLVPAGLAVAYEFAPHIMRLHLAAAVGGAAVAATIAMVYRVIRKRDGLGFGDVKLIGALGAWLGPEGLSSALILAVLLALLFVVGGVVFGRKVVLGDRIPFGSFLAAGGWIVWLYGPLVLGT
jgi:leader peptidase (prepilin peptidase) / N-methyltransferase